VVLVESVARGCAARLPGRRVIEALTTARELRHWAELFATARIGVAPIGRYETPDDLLSDAQLDSVCGTAQARTVILLTRTCASVIESRGVLELSCTPRCRTSRSFLLYQPI